MFAELANAQAAQDAFVFKPLSLKGPRTSSKSKQHQYKPSVALSNVLRSHAFFKGVGSKSLKGIDKQHLYVDRPLAYARASLGPADSRLPYGTFRTLPEAAAAAPLANPLTIVFKPKSRGGKKSYKKSHKKGGKKSHKKSHRRRH
jgi:hypothetical protein